MTPRGTRIAPALVCGVLMQWVAFTVSGMAGTEARSSWIMWNVWLAMSLAGPMPPAPKQTTIQSVMMFVGLVLGVMAYSTLIYFAMRALGARRVAPASLERVIAIILGFWWLIMRVPELGGPGMSETAVHWSAYGCLALVAILVGLIWIGRTRWRGLRIVAWTLLALMSFGVGP